VKEDARREGGVIALIVQSTQDLSIHRKGKYEHKHPRGCQVIHPYCFQGLQRADLAQNEQNPYSA